MPSVWVHVSSSQRRACKSSALVQPGSRIRERELLLLPPQLPLESLRAELRGRLTADHVRVSGYRDAQPQLKQFLEQLSRYLGLIGLTALFIGGLGVAMSINAFLREKLKTIAILKTLGADSSVLIGAYVLQAIGLGLIGSGAGMLLGILLQRVLPPLVAGAFVSDLLDQSARPRNFRLFRSARFSKAAPWDCSPRCSSRSGRC